MYSPQNNEIIISRVWHDRWFITSKNYRLTSTTTKMRTRFVTALHHKKREENSISLRRLYAFPWKCGETGFDDIQNQMHFEQCDYRTCAMFSIWRHFYKVKRRHRRSSMPLPPTRRTSLFHFCFHLTSNSHMHHTLVSRHSAHSIVLGRCVSQVFFSLHTPCAALIWPSFINTSHQHQHTIISISLSLLLLLLTSFCYTQFPFNGTASIVVDYVCIHRGHQQKASKFPLNNARSQYLITKSFIRHNHSVDFIHTQSHSWQSLFRSVALYHRRRRTKQLWTSERQHFYSCNMQMILESTEKQKIDAKLEIVQTATNNNNNNANEKCPECASEEKKQS